MENTISTFDATLYDGMYSDELIAKCNAIEKLATAFAEQIGYDTITFDVNCEDMSAYHFLEEVSFDIGYYDPKQRVESRNELQKWYDENNYHFDIHLATFGLLHEIGHLVAAYDMADEDLDLMLTNNNFSKMFIRDLDTYKKLEMEQDADREALAIYNKHTSLVKELDRAIRKELGL